MEKDESKQDVDGHASAQPHVDSSQGEIILSGDGIVLHPQPVDDPMDPLNWSTFHKHTILAIVMAL